MDLSWSAALTAYALGAATVLLVAGTRRKRKKQNRRIGLPAPQCQRFPDWDAATCMLTRRHDNFDHR